jgi:invasion protein IalB
MLIKIGILSLAIAFTLFAVAAIVIQKTGVMIVDVQSKDGRVFLPIPVGLINGALSLAPVSSNISLPHQFEDHSEVMQAAAQALIDCPDGPFVEVDSRDAQVLISKKGENMIIDVKSDDEKVYIQIPIRATGKTLSKLASLQQQNID